MLTTKC